MKNKYTGAKITVSDIDERWYRPSSLELSENEEEMVHDNLHLLCSIVLNLVRNLNAEEYLAVAAALTVVTDFDTRPRPQTGKEYVPREMFPNIAVVATALNTNPEKLKALIVSAQRKVPLLRQLWPHWFRPEVLSSTLKPDFSDAEYKNEWREIGRFLSKYMEKRKDGKLHRKYEPTKSLSINGEISNGK